MIVENKLKCLPLIKFVGKCLYPMIEYRKQIHNLLSSTVLHTEHKIKYLRELATCC